MPQLPTNSPWTVLHKVRRVLGHYDLGELKSALRVEHGYVNQNWVIQTTRGRYFLRHRHPELRDRAVINAQHALIDHLRKSGFPAPAILPAISGETIVVFDEEFYEIQDYIRGGTYQDGRSAQMEAAAIMLARYHDCVRDFTPSALCYVGNFYHPPFITTNLVRLKEVWTREWNPAAAEIFRQLESHKEDLRSRFALHRKLAHLVIHGDYHAGNLLFDGDRIVGVVDYDKAGWQPRIVELAEVLIYFASSRPGHLKHLAYPGFLEWDKFTSFLHHYTYAHGVHLTEQEVSALPDYIGCIWLSISLQRLLEKEQQSVEALEALQEVLSLCEWSVANRQQMMEICYGS